jgi:hypothetical protein
MLVACTGSLAAQSTPGAAEGLSDDGGASWRLEQPPPPLLQAGEPALAPIGLGNVGDIEFWAPNRGVLITAGSGSTIPPGLWTYDGGGWHELANVCGASDGRIAWAGPDEFWTISDGRPGQTSEANGVTPPLEDNTLCHFAGGQVVGSYAAPAFQASSYQPMHSAGCINPADCWFAGDPLPAPQVGVFQLHWNGSSLSAEPDPQGHAVEDMRLFGGRLYESVRLSREDKLTDPESPQHPPVLRRINPTGVQPMFVPLAPGLPEYAPGEAPEALDFLRLDADADALWAAAGAASEAAPAEVTVLRYAEGAWTQVLGPSSDPPGGNPFPGDVVESIAAEPGSESAWVALDSQSDAQNPSPLASATVARISANGAITDVQMLPTAEEQLAGVPPKGAAKRIVCPAAHDCWLTTTQGWLFHLATSTERSLPANGDPAFAGLIAFRPLDEGLPQVTPDAPPADDSGLPEGPPAPSGSLTEESASVSATTTAPLLSHLRTRLVHRDMLELSFHLAVRARVRLLASRHKRVVASTPTRTLGAGSRQLLLRLDPRRWPTKLDLQTHALAPLPKIGASSPGTSGAGPGTGPNSVGTVLRFPGPPSSSPGAFAGGPSELAP